MGIGRLSGWTGLIAPFFDRPDIQIPVIWYPAATPLTPGPPTIFTDRFYDFREHWLPLGPGTVPGSLQPYFGPLPQSVLGPQVGTSNDFAAGLSYAQYLAAGGSPLTPCAQVGAAWGPVKAPMVIAPGSVAGVSAGDQLVFDCIRCAAGNRHDGVLTVSGVVSGTRPAAPLNSSFFLGGIGACQWVSPAFAAGASPPTFAWLLRRLSPTTWTIELDPLPPGFPPPGFVSPPFTVGDCTSPFTIPGFPGGGPEWDTSAATLSVAWV